MIDIIYGKKSKTFQKTLEKILQRSSSSESERLAVTSENLERVFEYLQTPSLFGEQKTFIITDFEDTDIRDAFLEKMITDNPFIHHLVILLETLPVAWVRKIGDNAQLHAIAPDKEKTASFNAFSLANAFATGDKKKTWIAFQETLVHDDEMEKIHGMIWWKLKDMITKQRDPVKLASLKNQARELVHVYHDARKGGIGIKERLEKFFLEMK